MSNNPYEAPAAIISSEEAEDASSVRVELFQINDQAFNSQSWSRQDLCHELRRKMLKCCQEQGLRPSDSPEADIRIVGRVEAIDDGSQLLRYLVPLFAGASLVHIEGEIQRPGEPSRPFKQRISSRTGVFGGKSRTLIENGLQRTSLYVAIEAACIGRPASSLENHSVSKYFTIVATAALAIAILSTIAGYYWAMSFPRTHKSLQPGEFPISAIVAVVGGFVALMLLATAVAPTRVLRDRSMIWLLAMSGTKTLVGMRIVLFVLTLVAAVVWLFGFGEMFAR